MFSPGFPLSAGQALKDFIEAWVVIDIVFLPTLIAAFKRRSDLFHVFAVNVLTAWSIIGWVVAMIMAVADNERPAAYEAAYREPPRPAGPPASAHPATQWLYHQQQQAAAQAPPPPPYEYPGYDS